MRRYGKLRYSPRWLPRALGAAALAAGLLTTGLPAGPALASPATAGRASYDFSVSVAVRALGRTWSFGLLVTKGSDGDGIVAGLDTARKGVIESHEWGSVTAFSPTVAKDFTVTSAGRATIKTGGALSPVLAATLAFTPTRRTREACAKGSDTNYFGKVTGTLSLRTGLRGVKFSAKFRGKAPGAILSIDRSCVPPKPRRSKIPCTGGIWIVLAVPLTTGSAGGIQTLAAKPTWADSFIRENVPTASKWLTRSDDLFAGARAPAPKLNTKARTVAVAGTASGPITGAAVITYGPTYRPPPVRSCYVGRKHYSEKSVVYTGTSIAVSKPFQARTVLTGTQTMKTGTYATYTAVSLTAK